MKRILFYGMLAVLVLTLSACSKEEIDNQNSSQELPFDSTVTKDEQAFLVFANYTVIDKQCINGDQQHNMICLRVLSDTKPSIFVSENFGIKSLVEKDSQEEGLWHCRLDVPYNDGLQRTVMVTIESNNERLYCNLVQHWSKSHSHHLFYSTGVECNKEHSSEPSGLTPILPANTILPGKTCTSCNGTLKCQKCYYPKGSGICAECKGRGHVSMGSWVYDCFTCKGTKQCVYCDGSGLCFTCGGTGIIEDVDIDLRP